MIDTNILSGPEGGGRRLYVKCIPNLLVLGLFVSALEIHAEVPRCKLSERERQMVLDVVIDAGLRSPSIIYNSRESDKFALVVFQSEGVFRVTGRGSGIIDGRRGFVVPYYEFQLPSKRISVKTITVNAKNAREAVEQFALGPSCSQYISVRDVSLANELIGMAEFRMEVENLRHAIQSELLSTFSNVRCEISAITPGRLELVIVVEASCGPNGRVIVEASRSNKGLSSGVAGLWDPASAGLGAEMVRRLSGRPRVRTSMYLGRRVSEP